MVVNLLVHRIDAAELFLIKNEILVFWRVEDVHPVNVDWESMTFEVRVSLNHDVTGHLSILAEVESKTIDGWQLCMASNCCEIFEKFLRGLCSRNHEEFKHA